MIQAKRAAAALRAAGNLCWKYREVTAMPRQIKTLYVIHHSHTDIGYTDLQERVVQVQVDYIRSALRILGQARNAAFR